jgi:hypothetical protein
MVSISRRYVGARPTFFTRSTRLNLAANLTAALTSCALVAFTTYLAWAPGAQVWLTMPGAAGTAVGVGQPLPLGSSSQLVNINAARMSARRTCEERTGTAPVGSSSRYKPDDWFATSSAQPAASQVPA